LFIFTVKEVGFDKFINIIKSKYSIYFIVTMLSFTIVIYFLNQWLIGLIR